MRVLIVSVAIFACAAAAPSGLLASPLAYSGYSAPLGLAHAAPLALAHAAPLPVHHAAPLTVAINSGDLNGAVIDAHARASDYARAAVDVSRAVHDQHKEIAVDNSWKALNAAQIHSAQIDSAVAGVSPILAKQVAGHAAFAAPVSYAAPLGHAASLAYSAPLAHGLIAQSPIAYGHGIAHGW